MQAKLRVRISLQQKRKKYAVTKDDVLQTINRKTSHFNNSFDLDKIANFHASISLINPSNLLDLGFTEGIEYYSPELTSVGIGTIELGTDLFNHEVTEYPVILNYVTEAVIDKFKQLNSEGLLFIFIKNNYNKTSSFTLHNTSFKDFLRKSTKKQTLVDNREQRNDIRYRFFLDDIMLIERIYPKEISLNELLEEIIYVELDHGKHNLRVEMLSKSTDYEIAITDAAIDNQIFRNINDTSCSFEFH